MRNKKLIKLICAAAAMLCVCTSSVLAENAENNLYKMNLMQANENGGADAVSRGEFAAVLVRGFEVAKTEEASTFADMSGHWADSYVSAVSAAGITNGIGNNEFGPEYPVTLNQAVKMIISAVGYVPAEGDYPEAYLKIAEETGLLDGVAKGERVLTREEASALLLNGLNLYKVTYDEKGAAVLEFEKFISKLGYTVVDGDAKKIEKANINIWEDGQMPYKLENLETEQIPFMEARLVENDGEKTGAVIFYPGGAYHHMSEREMAQVPEYYNSRGLHVFIVNYRVEPYTSDAILSDAFRAVRYIRYNAEKYNIDPAKIGVSGHSAGGHLASCVSTLFDSAEKCIGDEIDEVSARPDFSVLGYPVISMTDEYAHKKSRQRFIGTETPSQEQIEKYSSELNVTENTPQTFIFHAVNDTSVNVINSLNYAKALKENKVKYELHVYPESGHGFGVGFDKQRACEWTQSCAEWLQFIGITE